MLNFHSKNKNKDYDEWIRKESLLRIGVLRFILKIKFKLKKGGITLSMTLTD